MKIRGLSIVFLTVAVLGLNACNKQEEAAPEAPAAEAPAPEAPAYEAPATEAPAEGTEGSDVSPTVEGDATTGAEEAPAQ